MSNFSALKTAVQQVIKQNGNEEITGAILQEILLSIINTLGDSAINNLETALQTETTNRTNADGTLQQNINSEATARGEADTALSNLIGAEETARENADTVLQGAITTINARLNEGYLYKGIATPTTDPSTPTGRLFYIATAAGTYTDFLDDNSQPLVVTKGINILKYNGSWEVQQVVGIDETPTAGSHNLVESGGVQNELALGAVYDVSAKNPTAGPNSDGKFTLEYILDQNNVNTLIPVAYRKGGMSIKFVCSSDNKYIQARCMAQNFTTDVTQWQGVDAEPTPSSKNFVESGGVEKRLPLKYRTLKGNNSGGKSINLDVTTGRTYKIDTSTPNWAVDTIGAESLKKFILRYTLDGGSTYTAIAEYTRDMQFKPVSFTVIADAVYSIFFRANTGVEVTFSIEDITEVSKETSSAINSLNITDATSSADKATQISMALRSNSTVIDSLVIEQASENKAGLLPAKETWDEEFKADSKSVVSSGVCFKESPVKKIRLKGADLGGKNSSLLTLNSGRIYRIDTPTPNWDVTGVTSEVNKFILRKTNDDGATYTNIVTYSKSDQFKPVEFVAEEGYKYLIFFRATNNVYVDFYVSDVINQSQLVKIQIGEWNVGKFGFGTNWGIAEDDNYDVVLNKTKKVLTEIAADVLFVCEYSFNINRSRTINSYNTVLKQFYPYTAINSNDGWCCIFSKYPIINQQEVTVGTRHYMKGEIVINGTTIGIYCFHGNPASPEDRITEFGSIVAEMNQYQYCIIAGDTNVSNNSGSGETPEIQEQELNVFRNAGYTLANVGYWGSKYTEYTGHHALDNIMCKGFNIDSFVVNQDQASSDHLACSSNVSCYQM